MFLPFFYICELRDPSAPRCFSSIALPLAVCHGKEKSPGIFLPFQVCLSLQRPQECLLVQVFRIGLPHPPCSCRASGRTCKRLRRIHLCISRFPSPPKPHLHSPCSLFTLYTPPVPHRFIFLHFYFCIRKPETAHSPMPVSGVSLSVSTRCFSFSIHIVSKTQSSFFLSSLSMRSNTMS